MSTASESEDSRRLTRIEDKLDHASDHTEGGDSRLVRIEIKLDHVIDTLKEVKTDHEGRIRQLERWKYALPASAVAAAIAALAAIFGR